MLAARFLRPIGVPLISAVIPPHARISCFGKFNYFCSRGAKSQVLYAVPKSSYKYFDLRRFDRYAQKLRGKFSTEDIYACSVAGTIVLLTPNAGDCFPLLFDYPQTSSSDASHIGEKLRCAMVLIGKLLVPVFLFLTVWMNWGQCHPVFLAARVALIFLCTKPIPSSVYIFADQLKHQMRSRQPFLYRFRPLQLKKVEIEDYTFLCVARVELADEQLMLIGILGSWWIFPWSSWRETIFV